jgi:hypothetical protein
MNYFKTLLALMTSLFVIFLLLDFFNLTAFLLFPYSTITGKNKNLTTSVGNTPATNGG